MVIEAFAPRKETIVVPNMPIPGCRYQEARPDGVLLDITMPDMDGLQALKELPAIDPSARVAMCTAMGQQSMVLEALKAGARDYVVKPFDAARVIAAVKKMAG